MGDEKYINRIFDRIVEFTLKSKGALVIVGPKWCGKSTTAKRYANTVIDLMLKDIPLRKDEQKARKPSLAEKTISEKQPTTC